MGSPRANALRQHSASSVVLPKPAGATSSVRACAAGSAWPASAGRSMNPGRASGSRHGGASPTRAPSRQLPQDARNRAPGWLRRGADCRTRNSMSFPPCDDDDPCPSRQCPSRRCLSRQPPRQGRTARRDPVVCRGRSVARPRGQRTRAYSPFARGRSGGGEVAADTLMPGRVVPGDASREASGPPRTSRLSASDACRTKAVRREPHPSGRPRAVLRGRQRESLRRGTECTAW